ncbi:hypothetical protein MKUB_54730 [Mycobacterium kubicae]|uniref:IstB-like ATP-binding domain-containing protein n=1 Tax=Mycobacterium kubicae TaxID=120959 RepID=A0ABQ1BWM7_9MYCO|nr:hypothetical protein MKUB_54730 [Mycobacterium kubicae]
MNPSWPPRLRSPPPKPVILTSNLPFSRWGQVFGEPTIASAIIDRIVHNAENHRPSVGNLAVVQSVLVRSDVAGIVDDFAPRRVDAAASVGTYLALA